MKWFWYILLLGVVSITTEAADDDIDTFFESYGYLDVKPPPPDGSPSHSAEDREKAIRYLQRMLNLPVTGELDKKTVKRMKAGRCGVKDLVPPRERKNADPNGPLPFYAIGTKWDKSRLTYKFVGYTRQLSQSQQRRAIRNALSKWSTVTNLNFQEVSSGNADILINYGVRYHGDDYPFDGKSGTLAHAFFPGGDAISGDTHFDDAEKWTVNTPDGTNLEIVAAHEFGHALGLSHSNVKGALMAPYYAGYDPNYQLHTDDVQGIQSLYGVRRRQPTAPTRRPTTRRPPQRPTTKKPPRKPKDPCKTRFDAIFSGPDRRLYAMRGKKLYKFERDANGIEQARYVRKTYKKAPKNVGAVVMDRYGRLFMFKGKKYWRYNARGELDKGYPKVIKGANNFFRKAQAAVMTRTGQIYLIKGNQLSAWREDFVSPPSGYPVPVTRIFPGAPNNIDAAIRWGSYIYFFDRAKYYKFGEHARGMYLVRGYPKRKAAAWLGCGRAVPK